MSGSQFDRLKRFERRLSVRLWLSAGAARVVDSVPAAVQIVLAATASYAIAHFGLGHAFPIVAVTVTISLLGFARDARPRRVVEIGLGILLGIALAEVFLVAFGQGIWQTAVVLLVVLLAGRFFSKNPAFAAIAGVQSALVMLMPTPDGGPFVRSLDGVIAGVIALLATALIPRDPLGASRRTARALFSTVIESTDSLIESLEHAAEPAADLALSRLRRSQALVDEWTLSLDTAISVSRISPFLRRQLPALRGQARVLRGMDLTARHLRVIARRIDFLVRDGVERPALAGLLREVRESVRLLGEHVQSGASTAELDARLRSVAAALAPDAVIPNAGLTDAMVVLLVRPLVVDLLVAGGADIDEVRGLLPPV